MTARSVAAFVVLAATAPAWAQQLELPRPSPNAKASQFIGLTEVTIEYSSPGVKGRTIWGALVPYGEVWRAGANATTKLTFSKEVSIGGTTLPAGSYAYFVIPAQKGNWTIVINRDFAESGAFSYKKDLDVVRVDVKPETIPSRERLAYVFSNFTNEGGNLDLEWEKVRLSLPIKVGTDQQVATNLKNFDDNAWSPYNAAARYQLDKKDYDTGLMWVEKSLQIKEEWLNVFTKAQLLAGKGNLKDAYPLAQKAQQLGEKSKNFFLSGEVKKALVDWKPKS